MQAGRRHARRPRLQESAAGLSSGDILLLDDGRIVLAVTRSRARDIYCLVEQGGELSNNKGINRKGGGLTAPALTEKDMRGHQDRGALKADYLAVSFPRSGADMQWRAT